MKNKSYQHKHSTVFSLSLIALGIVYGDIGTSPLYAMHESLEGLPINLTDVLGVLSLIFWSLLFIISLKYLVVLFHADNEGEGGILALYALLKQFLGNKTRFAFLIGTFGAGLILGDGMIAPAISVISAIEGLHVIVPSLSHWVIPLTIVLLIAIFSIQSFGTAKIGFVFGPAILIWFVILATLGTIQILQNPIVLKAINPWYAFEFFHQNGWKGYTHLGGVFLVVTGGEALYADLGHLGKSPIRLSWFTVALPGLLLNYFGQGAYLLEHPEAIVNPFYLIAPDWFLVPLLFFSTIAAIIASQAVISATFSLTKQAVLLGLYPYLPIKQTSSVKKGQIYVPQMNLLLALGSMLLVLTFKSSTAIAHAYGIAINLVMILSSMLVAYLAIKKWRLSWWLTIPLFSFFGVIDLAFLGANAQKLLTGGWVPIVFALICAFIMYTWHSGMQYVREHHFMKRESFSKILKQLHYKSLNRLPNVTAIFITDVYDRSGGSFLHMLKLTQSVPENILIISYLTENVPHIKFKDRFEVSCLDKNIYKLTLHFGFMDYVSLPQALHTANKRNILPFKINVESAVYFMEIPTIVASRRQKTLLFFWQEKLFSFLSNNYSTNKNIDFYQLPFNRTIAIGAYYLI
ncbi:MAG: KUP/HAK/KT family potassium transporter [Legionellaceae bacterium]|nr:KUP/HAK/KT family potassium transporter [Legionellaceae bacterium]